MRFDKESDVKAHFRSIAEGEFGADNFKIEYDGMDLILMLQEKKNAYLEWMHKSGKEVDFTERVFVPVRKAVLADDESYWLVYISRDKGKTWMRANG